MPKIVNEIHNVVFGVPAILNDDYVIVVEVSRLTGIVAIECDWVELGQDLGSKKCNIKDVENYLEDVLLLEHSQSQVAESLGFIDQVNSNKRIAFMHVLVFDYL